MWVGIICPNLLAQGVRYGKAETKKNNVLNVAQKQPSKETPEQMIRSLQAIFCKDRYRSWTFTQSKKTN